MQIFNTLAISEYIVASPKGKFIKYYLPNITLALSVILTFVILFATINANVDSSSMFYSLYNMNNVDILDEAIEAKNPYNINITKQIIIYFLIGFVLSAGILFIIFYFDRTVKSIEQVEQKIKLPILGGVQEYNKGVKKKWKKN